MKEHLGIALDDTSFEEKWTAVESDEVFHAIRAIAKGNTDIYEEVFACIPSNSLGTFEDMENMRKKRKEAYDNLIVVAKGKTSGCSFMHGSSRTGGLCRNSPATL